MKRCGDHSYAVRILFQYLQNKLIGNTWINTSISLLKTVLLPLMKPKNLSIGVSN